MGSIRLATEIPGPKAQALLARRAAATPSPLAHSTQVVVARARGAVVEDVDGNHLLDLAGGIGMLNVGHCPEGVVEAVREQAGELLHVCALVASYEPYVALAEALNACTPGDHPKKTLLSNSGAEAVENAVKVARVHTGRAAVITFEGGYHGRTLLTLSLTSKYGLFKKGFGPFAPEIYRLPAPNVYRRPRGLSEEDYVAECVASLDRALVTQVAPSAVAAILIEPVQGEAGFLPMPAPFLRRIRELCDEHGIVMIADEVQSGFGRTGKMFAIDHYDLVPDVVTMAKSLGAGLPIAATTGRAEIMDAPHKGGLGGTFGGSPVACAAALATLRELEKGKLLERASSLGERIQARFDTWRDELPLVGEGRGLGAMQLLELVRNHDTLEPASAETLRVVQEAQRRGLVMIRAGLYSNCVRLLPPLVITDEQLDEALDALGEALAAVHEAAAS